jgi:hypothetical protein
MDLSSLSGEAFTGGFEASPVLHTREPRRRIGAQHMAARRGHAHTANRRESLPYEQPLVLPQVPHT